MTEVDQPTARVQQQLGRLTDEQPPLTNAAAVLWDVIV
ncbi:phage-related minor tail protein [Rhodococcus percolatus]|nr:phage-related minor tail protein [Rhodococcus opacus]MBP2207384.1 phage-related minor tail protein [Rhodococcus opacus]CAG7579840.1 hypothetical protein E143388_00053 [Rhodococcus opacus]